jgi:hypothetical protein
LFTPGPLLTKLSVREAMMTDYGSRDIEFMKSIDYVRDKLLDIAGLVLLNTLYYFEYTSFLLIFLFEYFRCIK